MVNTRIWVCLICTMYQLISRVFHDICFAVFWRWLLICRFFLYVRCSTLARCSVRCYKTPSLSLRRRYHTRQHCISRLLPRRRVLHYEVIVSGIVAEFQFVTDNASSSFHKEEISNWGENFVSFQDQFSFKLTLPSAVGFRTSSGL